MENLKPTKVYVPTNEISDLKIYKGNTFKTLKKIAKVKEQEGYFFTKLELEKLLEKTWNASIDEIIEHEAYPHGRNGGYIEPSKDEYINQLIK